MTFALALATAAAEAPRYVAELSTVSILNVLLLSLLAATGLAIVFSRRLFVVVMLSGAYTLLSAAFFTTLDAVDVAFTEAAVGAGMSTVLMLGAMLLTAREADKSPVSRRYGAALIVLVTGAVLLYATPDTALFGDPGSPANAYVGALYVERTPSQVDVPNVVTAVLASYRGFDTFGEVVVVFTAGLGVMLLLGLRAAAPGAGARPLPHEPEDPQVAEENRRIENADPVPEDPSDGGGEPASDPKVSS